MPTNPQFIDLKEEKPALISSKHFELKTQVLIKSKKTSELPPMSSLRHQSLFNPHTLKNTITITITITNTNTNTNITTSFSKNKKKQKFERRFTTQTPDINILGLLFKESSSLITLSEGSYLSLSDCERIKVINNILNYLESVTGEGFLSRYDLMKFPIIA